MSEAPPDGPRTVDLGRWLAVAGIVAGIVLLAAGIWQATPRGPAWFAYAPLSSTTFVPSGPGVWLGPALIGGGALLAGLGVGFLLGRRRRD